MVDLSVTQITESITVIAITLITIGIAVVKYLKTQLDIPEAKEGMEHEVRKVVSAVRDHQEETSRLLVKINNSLTSIKEVVENKNE